MDKQLMKMHADTLNVLEAKCLVQLDTTLNQCFIHLVCILFLILFLFKFSVQFGVFL